MKSFQSYVNSLLKKDPSYSSIFIDPDENDIDLILNHTLSIFKNKFPNRTFKVSKKYKNQILILIINESIESLDKDNKLYYKDFILDELFINDVINNFLDETTKQYILNKYKYQTIDYRDKLNELIESIKVLEKIENYELPLDIKFESKTSFHKYENLTFSIYKHSKSSYGLGKFLFYKNYDLIYDIITFKDYNNIVKISKQLNKVRNN